MASWCNGLACLASNELVRVRILLKLQTIEYIVQMMYIILTLAIEFVLFIIWIFYRAIKEIKEEEKESRIYPPDFFDR